VSCCASIQEVNASSAGTSDEKFAGTPASLIPSMPDQTQAKRSKRKTSTGSNGVGGNNGVKSKRKKPSALVISNPRDFRQKIHVDFDSDIGFRGLPAEWETMLRTGGISKDDVVNHSERVLEVLEFQANGMKPLPRHASEEKAPSTTSSTTSSTTTAAAAAASPSPSPTTSATLAAEQQPATPSDDTQVSVPASPDHDAAAKEIKAGDVAEAIARKKKKKKKAAGLLEDGMCVCVCVCVCVSCVRVGLAFTMWLLPDAQFVCVHSRLG
jgi:hypothetical protein